MKANIAVLPGDGIGPEVTAEAVKVLKAVGQRYNHEFVFHYALIGGAAIDRFGTALPDATLDLCRRSHAVLLGAVGGPQWDDPQAKVRPEDGLLAIRKGLGLFANLRPVKMLPCLVHTATLKAEAVKDVDLVVVRELTGGLYFGKPKRQWHTSRGRRAVDTMAYSEREIERILRMGFELARQRRHKLTSVDKANVLETSRLWRQKAMEMAPLYPDVELEHMLVDNCAMQLIRQPSVFDVIVTENTFGDILTDEASLLAGSMGMLPSASLGSKTRKLLGERWGTFGLYEPIHGSAPRRAGQNLANPIATILSAALLLRHSLCLVQEAEAVEQEVTDILDAGYRTYDIMEAGMKQVGTKEMGDLVSLRISAGSQS
ncbi:MAG: 3-isopropylmalate dehydrogenase [Chloroflexi bacterium]|nr:3-isopropylmalate dehydrogenase [Chloroflexota bacterium]